MRILGTALVAAIVAGPALAADLREDIRLVGHNYGLFRACTAWYADRGGLDALSFRVPREDRNLKALDALDASEDERKALSDIYDASARTGFDIGINRIRILDLQAEVGGDDDKVLEHCSAAAARVEPCLENESNEGYFAACASSVRNPEPA